MQSRENGHFSGQSNLVCLGDKDVLSAKISDHYPVIQNEVLFWNIMMQAKKNSSGRYNNGFGSEETEKKYLWRLQQVANVIAEILARNPTIEVISLCEGPIQHLHVQTFLQTLKKFSSLRKFFHGDTMRDYFHKPYVEGPPEWGLLMLANKKYQVSAVDLPNDSKLLDKLANRFQLWKLETEQDAKYVALAHLPFGGDEEVDDYRDLSALGHEYARFMRNLLRQFADQQLIICADFNFNPYLIGKWVERSRDNITSNNSLVLKQTASTRIVSPVTVDGILFSRFAKQTMPVLGVGLFAIAKREIQLVSSLRWHDGTDVVKEQRRLGNS